MIREWWNHEIEFYRTQFDYTLDQARTFVILRWMWEGDLHPLGYAILERWPLDDAVLVMLADMISDKPVSHPLQARYQIKAVQRVKKRGRSKNPARVGQRYLVGKAYDEHKIGGSDAAFEAIGQVLNMSPKTVRLHYKAYREGRSAK